MRSAPGNPTRAGAHQVRGGDGEAMWSRGHDGVLTVV
jgi:hypothetical protein